MISPLTKCQWPILGLCRAAALLVLVRPFRALPNPGKGVSTAQCGRTLPFPKGRFLIPTPLALLRSSETCCFSFSRVSSQVHELPPAQAKRIYRTWPWRCLHGFQMVVFSEHATFHFQLDLRCATEPWPGQIAALWHPTYTKPNLAWGRSQDTSMLPLACRQLQSKST